jgi:tetratricopeptide (TPR) repeat protein
MHAQKVVNLSVETALRTAGEVFIYDGDYEMALDLVERTLEVAPQEQRALVLKGDILFCLNRDTEALALFNQALDLTPHCIEALVSKAGVLEVLQRPREAVRCCNEALVLVGDTDHPLLLSIFDQKLQLLVLLKRYREAEKLLVSAKSRLIEREYQFLFHCHQGGIQVGLQHRLQRWRTGKPSASLKILQIRA